MKKLSFYCITLLLLTACAQKVVKCGLVGENMNPQKLPSVVTINENILIADTTIVSISGKVLGSYIHERKDTITEPLEFANVMLTNVKTKEVFGQVTEVGGLYNLTIPAATYTLDVRFIGYNQIVVENVKLGTGEILNFSANLGQGIGEEYFRVRNHRTTKELIRKTN